MRGSGGDSGDGGGDGDDGGGGSSNSSSSVCRLWVVLACVVVHRKEVRLHRQS